VSDRTPGSFPAKAPAPALQSVGVVGGGTAGYFAALAVKRRFPELRVTLVESRAVPIIGVGEATTTLMPPFLHQQLGLDIVHLFEAVRPTFKLGIRFVWGLPGEHEFTYPFGDAQPVEAFAHGGDLHDQSLASMLMEGGAGPVVREADGTLRSLLASLKLAYHLDNEPFVAFLAAAAARAGIEHVDVTLDAAEPLPDGSGVAALRAHDGRELRFDVYVDASGFRSLLLEGALESPFRSYASSLFCDSAVVAAVPQDAKLEPYTTAETMDAGWCWRIPVAGEDHRGYVFSSAFLDDDRAAAEMRAKNPSLADHRVVRFRSGRHRDFWIGNTVAVGNAYGFVEPLESTALHMVIVEVAYLLEGIEELLARPAARDFARRASESVGGHWDYLRWFLAVHYRFNRRMDTPFWRAARADADVSGLAEALDRFARRGPWNALDGARFGIGDPAFGHSGLMTLLLGQRAPGSEHARAKVDRSAWAARVAALRAVAARALPQREALRALHAHPELLRELVDAPSSWCHAEGRHPASLARTGRVAAT
jgi:tryptophan halogenase